MPKRRVRTASQRAASVRNLEQARKKLQGSKVKRTGNTGKNVLMVHHTSAKRKNQIVKDQAFKPHPHQANVGHVFVTPYANRKSKDFRGKFGYGYTGVVVSVPRKALKTDTDWPHPQSKMFHVDAIKGRRIRGLRRGE